MNRITLASRDLPKLSRIALAVFDCVENIHCTNKHKLTDLICQAMGYRNRHDVDAELRVREPVLPEAGTITLHELQLTLARGLQRIVDKQSGGRQQLDLVEAFSHVLRADLEPLSIYKSTVEYLHTQLLLADADKTANPVLARAAARRNAEIEQCWTPYRERLKSDAFAPYQIAVRYDRSLGYSDDHRPLVRHWPTAVSLFRAVQAARTDRDIPFGLTLDDLHDPDGTAGLIPQVLMHYSVMKIEDFVVRERIPYHEVIWLFSDEGEYIGRVLRHTVHGAIVAGLLHTDEDVLEGKASVLINEPLTWIHQQHYQFLEARGTLPVFTLKAGYQPPKGIASLQDRPRVPVEHLVRIPGLSAGYLLINSGARVDEKAWDINGQRISIHPELSSQRAYEISYLECESWLDEPDLPELFRQPKSVVPDDLLRHEKVRSFLPDYAIELQERATYLFNTALDEYAQVVVEQLQRGELLPKLETDDDLAQAMEAQSFTHLYTSDEAGTGQQDLTIHAVAAALKAHDSNYERFGAYTLWRALGLCGPKQLSGEVPSNLPVMLAYLAGACAAETIIEPVSERVLHMAVGQWLAGLLPLQSIPAVINRFHEIQQKLTLQEERMAAVKAYVQEHKALERAANAHGMAYVYGKVPVSEPERLKRAKRH
ncbi:hypothetical protein ACIPZ5_05560 [Pseudomonas sp. NPDC089428]|uniref:hypothetical protein n=1 Tax=Pseudomonas sp. NPDC089428 TaxID=3364467 RepID=UPI0037FE452F